MSKNPLLNRDFLLKLDNQQSKKVYVKLISLNNREEPIELIEGSVVSGSVNIDGSSSVARSCSLSLTTNNINITDVYWSLTTRFKLYIGLNNEVDNTYDDIIWFPQGTYLITSFKISHSINSCTISISGKDKMALLNGDVGGSFPHAIVLSAYDDIDEQGNKISIPVPMYRLIRELIHTYGKEPYENIDVQDVATYGLELVNNNDYDLYIKYYLNGSSYEPYLNSNDQQQFIWVPSTIDDESSEDEQQLYEQFKDITDDQVLQYDSFSDLIVIPGKDLQEYTDEDTGDQYVYMRYRAGEAIGYRACDFIWPDQTNELTVNVGETITSVLDKICSTLGNYEYFYDVNGIFHFQSKPTYINESWNNLSISNDEVYVNASQQLTSQYSYSFNNDVLIQSYDNSPNLANIKNNFSIWGKNNASVGIQMCCAIQKKPTQYYSLDGRLWLSSEIVTESEEWPTTLQVTYDGVEYTLSHWYNLKEWYNTYSNDYDLGSNLKKYLIKTINLDDNNTDINSCRIVDGIIAELNVDLDITDETIYIYEPILVVDWRELIYQMAVDYQEYQSKDNYATLLKQYNPEYIYGVTNFEQYYTDLLGQGAESHWRSLYDYTNSDYETENREHLYWNKLVYTEPSSLKFWFDFIEATDSDLSKYSVDAIGNRLKTSNNDKVKAIVYKTAPTILWFSSVSDDEEYEAQTTYFSGYTPITIDSDVFDTLTMVKQGVTAKETLDDLLYQNTYVNETISLRAIPIYYLEPNTLIKVIDKTSGIEGDYIINKISYNLSHKDLMSISATKKPNRLY